MFVVVMILGVGGWGWRLLAVFGFVLVGELGLQFGMAGEALRFGSVMLCTPVSLLLEICGELCTALRTDPLGHAVFCAPPAAMIVC